MNNIEACKHVLEHGVSLVRFRKGSLQPIECDMCQGSGVKAEWRACDPNDRPLPDSDCPLCKGKGKVSSIPQYDIKPYFSGNKRGWMALDTTTASAINAVYEHLKTTQRPIALRKIHYLPWDKLAGLAFRSVK